MKKKEKINEKKKNAEVCPQKEQIHFFNTAAIHRKHKNRFALPSLRQRRPDPVLACAVC